MLPTNQGQGRGDVVLGVVVADGAVALRSAHVVVEGEGWRGWSAHRVWWRGVGGAPAQLCQIIARKKWRPAVDKAASRQVHVENGGGCKGVVNVEDEQFAVVKLGATVLTEAG